ncbi:MAG: hypothetical protein CMB64_06525 [Euryarchaeota archaeon]|nr:hypothetical protein [Euryarchaeota archaeon]|tara:strand:- start:539 stop:1954 length:1416 start_codon:yes stop_codon:yes gene_type:complete
MDDVEKKRVVRNKKNIKKSVKSKIPSEVAEKFKTIPNRNSLEIQKYRRELRRTRNSASFRIGNLVINSIVKPWKIILLPFNLIKLSWELASERLGWKNVPSHDSIISSTKRNTKSILVFPTNGVGFGHFTRILAVAKRIKKLNPGIEVIFFTTMTTLHILKEQGEFVAYHIPGRKKFKEMDAKTWNTLTEEIMENIFAIHNPSLFIFDGAYPYRGMLNSIKNQEGLKKVWLRKGTLKKGFSKDPKESINRFNYIIRPKDSVEYNDEVDDDYIPDLIKCNPILMLDKSELLSKKDACARLGVPEKSKIVYVQLGAGNINNINSEIGMTLDVLKEFEDLYVVIGESMIGKRMNITGERVRIIRDYPNSRFFNAFDFAIMAAGYNSFHEAIHFSLPTIFYPNLNTGQDDQLARAKIAEDLGAMMVVKERKRKNVENAIKKIYDENIRERMKENIKKLHAENGAEQIAKYLIDLI